MSRETPSCELEEIELTEDYYMQLESFLYDVDLSSLEAQVILEVIGYRQHHIDMMTLDRKVPSELKEQSYSIESVVRELIKGRYLLPYSSKKDELCVLSGPRGRDIARLIRERCLSGGLKHFPHLRQKYQSIRNSLCYDHENFKEGQERTANLRGKRLKILIVKIRAADTYQTDEGKKIYDRRLTCKIDECPQCRKPIQFDYTFNPENIYTESVNVVCVNCGFRFLLSRSMRWAHDSG